MERLTRDLNSILFGIFVVSESIKYFVTPQGMDDGVFRTFDIVISTFYVHKNHTHNALAT